MSINMDPIYGQFFPAGGALPNDWEPFKRLYAERSDFTKPDFIISTEKTWQDTAKTIATTVLKVILFPWGLYEVCKALIDRVAMLLIYPAQLQKPSHIRGVRACVMQEQDPNRILREVVLQKNGSSFGGLLVGQRDTISNGKWALFSSGNMFSAQDAYVNDNMRPFLSAGYNVLLINGPGVGGDSGVATVEGLGDAQDVGISFLEEAIKANKIILSGQSLGGAAMGLAILKHTFKSDVEYLAIRFMTFDRLSHAVKELAGWIAEKAIGIFGLEMDSVAASKKLQENQIHEVVIEAEHDEVLGRCGLLPTLQKENLLANKTAYRVLGASHCCMPVQLIAREIERWDQVAAAV